MESIPKSSPWGAVDGHTVLAPGIVSVSTSSHGGIHLDRAHAATMRGFLSGCSNFLDSWTWWEEDSDWAIPFVVFSDEITRYIVAAAQAAGGPTWESEHLCENMQAASKSWKNWNPDSYERYYGVTLTAEESYKRREAVSA